MKDDLDFLGATGGGMDFTCLLSFICSVGEEGDGGRGGSDLPEDIRFWVRGIEENPVSGEDVTVDDVRSRTVLE